jgi:ankyrin repeat protein
MRFLTTLILAGSLLSSCAADQSPLAKSRPHDSLGGLNDPLVAALRRKDYQSARFLLESGYPVSGRASYPQTPVFWVIAENNIQGLRLLIHSGLNVNYDWGKTAGNLLTNAVQYGHLEQVQLLCEAGASVNRKPQFGRSPLYSSVIYSRHDIERYLRGRGARFNKWDTEAFRTLGMKLE